MVLRDLTARQYVRGDAFIAKCAGSPRLSHWRESWGLADLIILGICYSGEPSGLMSVRETSLERGIWSGHRFDVVEEKNLLEPDEWMDVSGQILRVGHILWQIDGHRLVPR
ncbi:hypothetical protein EXIGLDRAFT_727533 [Exidia glandulosa HHB12029]|uniref:Uncharacterized protein n=1 Tax=Exidia glandulosa HHB12029 TaxID=1314781 RepID=A0A165DBR0_EXIGL|nr:hypothetical protein EXIGLDRAFT_727533 [Exidia glandulosa HHB12029]